MKKFIYLLLCTILSNFFGYAQDAQPTVTQNYIYKTTLKERYLESQLSNAPNTDKLETIIYYDGLGREKQSVLVRQGGSHNNAHTDIIVPSTYDIFGRQDKTYLPLPVSANNGHYNGAAIEDINNYYLNKYPEDLNSDRPNPFSSSVFDESPLNRIKEQGAPGKFWDTHIDDVDIDGHDNHSIRFLYGDNDVKEVPYLG